MSAEALAEVSRCSNEFAINQTEGNALLLSMAALGRDGNELDQKFAEAQSQGNDVIPIFTELFDHLIERAGIAREVSENASQAAALCRQTAAAMRKLAR